jgi:hypothetical protein
MERTAQIEMNRTGWLGWLGTHWCRQFHTSVMWPIHGEYVCSACGIRHSVPWEPRDRAQAQA